MKAAHKGFLLAIIREVRGVCESGGTTQSVAIPPAHPVPSRATPLSAAAVAVCGHRRGGGDRGGGLGCRWRAETFPRVHPRAPPRPPANRYKTAAVR